MAIVRISGIISLVLVIVIGVPAYGQVVSGAQLTFEPYGINVVYPATWVEVTTRYQNARELQSVDSAARLMITVEQRINHEDAITRLRQIDTEYDEPPTFLAIDGWPALQRRAFVPESQPGQPDPAAERHHVWLVTTAVAADDLVVRLQGVLQPAAAPQLADEMQAIGRSLTFRRSGSSTEAEQTIRSLQSSPRLMRKLAPSKQSAPAEDQPGGAGKSAGSTLSEAGGTGASAGLTLRVNNSNGVDSEIEIAVSTDGQHIVIANNSRDYRTSNDGGITFPTANTSPVPPGGAANGDPSLAYGASGSFYFAYIGFPAAGQCSTGITRSDDNGVMFQFLANATVCNDAGIGNPEPNTACFPDQEHIAADRFNLSSTSGQDQVYSTWRDFTGGGCGPAGTPTAIAGPEVPSLVCSTDSGQNWTAKIAVGNMNDNYPRITVGQDGFVYVVYRAGTTIMVNKYSSCDTGLGQQVSFPRMIAGGISDVTCGAAGAVPGLDRCNNGSNLSSHTVAVDDTDADHIYAAYAVNTNPGVNENVLVQDSSDGGFNWGVCRANCTNPVSSDSLAACTAGGCGGETCCPEEVQVNNGQIGRRFMPWTCTIGGAVYVSWYDMRAAFGTPGSGLPNDLADYYSASAFVDSSGKLRAGPEFLISEVSDALCAAGWPAAPRNQNDSESCGVQPQLAGICQDAMGNNQAAPNRCDFSDCGGAGMNAGAPCQCNAGFVCNLGGGVPKYGDYSGNACAAGRLYTAWASATSPPSITPASTDIDVFFVSTLVCCEPQIQAPLSLSFGDVCSGDSLNEELPICNTGKEDLRVDSITSDDPQFTVAPSSSGFPVVISPDFCFPFQVRFTPTSPGAQTATLTIASNDSVNPSVTVQATGQVGAPNIVLDPPDLDGIFAFPATVTDLHGDLGCFSERMLVIRNNGTCPLMIEGITASSPFNVLVPTQFPVTLPPGEETLEVTVRFEPTTGGAPDTAPNETTGTLTVVSDDPGGEATAGLCGEAVVQSGVRALVVDGTDTPIASVDMLTLASQGIHTPSPIRISVTDVAPTTTTVCTNTVRFHLNQEDLPPTQTTGSNPQSSYATKAKEGNKQVSQSFGLGQCEFKQFILKLR